MKTIKKFIGFSLGPIIGMIISLITVPVTTHFILPNEYGKAALFSTTQSVLLLFIYFGMDHSYMREYHENDNKNKLMTNCLIVPLLFTFVVLFFSPLYYKNLSLWLFGEIHFDVIILFGISLVCVTLTRFVYLSIRMKERAVLYSILHIIAKLLILFFTLGFIIFGRRDYLAVVYSSLLGQIIFDCCLMFLFHKEVHINLSQVDISYVKSLIQYGLPFAGVAIIGYLLNSIDNYFLKFFSSYEEIGYYVVAAKICNFLTVIQNAFNAFWAPISFRWYAENKPVSQYENVGKLLAFGMSSLFLLLVLFRGAIGYVLSSNYLESIRIIPFLLIYPVMYTLGLTTELGMQFKKKSQYTFIYSCIALGINMALNFILVPILHARGAAITTGVSFIIFFWLKTIKSRTLWEKFSIKYLVVMNIIMLLSACVNTFIENDIFLMCFNAFLLIVNTMMFSQQFLQIITFGKKKLLNLRKSNVNNE